MILYPVDIIAESPCQNKEQIDSKDPIAVFIRQKYRPKDEEKNQYHYNGCKDCHDGLEDRVICCKTKGSAGILEIGKLENPGNEKDIRFSFQISYGQGLGPLVEGYGKYCKDQNKEDHFY